MAPTAHNREYNGEQVLFVAFELSSKKWKLGMTKGRGIKQRNRSVDAGDFAVVEEAIGRAKKRFGLDKDVLVVSCYEAGRDGFWIHRRLERMGIKNVVIDPASVDVKRKKKNKKTDRLDLVKLLKNLILWWEGDESVWSVVRVPTVEAEDARHFHREFAKLKGERTRHTARIKSLLILHGVRLRTITADFLDRVEEIRLHDGTRLPPQLKSRLWREYERLSLVNQQILTLEEQRRNALAEADDPRLDDVRKLMRLRGVADNGAWLLVMEVFGWRKFENRKQVGSIAGLTPTPHASGDLDRQLGIDKAGITRVRAMMIQLAWCWVRHQPKSEITLWFNERFAPGSRRHRRIGIVAVARKLLIAFWRYLEHDVVPAGAQLKQASA
jgi:transposase